MEDNKYLLALYAFPDFGPARTKLLITYFKTAKKVWNTTLSELLDIGIKKSTAEKFIVHRNNFDLDSYFEKLDRYGIKFVTKSDKLYPSNLKGLEDAPVVLYYLGTISKNDADSIAIVGSRKMTYYGREVAEKFAGELAGYGITIISGLARGIDTVVHRSTLNAGGKTIAVVASGLDTIYPPENLGLAKEIIKKGGIIFSEYPLGYPALPANFPSRNRIVSGMSKAVVVVEGYKKSGTLLTASHAATQGRTVFAVPGQITSPMSEAPHYLLQNGAKFAFSVKDIIDELDLQVKVDKDAINKILPEGKDEIKICEILGREPLHLDEIVRISGMSISEVSSVLMSMRLKGLVKEMGGGLYKKN